MEKTPLPARRPDRGRRYIWLSMRTSPPVGTWNYAGRRERRRVVCPFALSLAVRMAHAQMGRATPLSLSAGHPRRLHEGAPDCARRDSPCPDPRAGDRARADRARADRARCDLGGIAPG